MCVCVECIVVWLYRAAAAVDVGSLGRGNFTAGLLLSHSGRKCCRFAVKIEMVSVQEQSIEPTKMVVVVGGVR